MRRGRRPLIPPTKGLPFANPLVAQKRDVLPSLFDIPYDIPHPINAHIFVPYFAPLIGCAEIIYRFQLKPKLPPILRAGRRQIGSNLGFELEPV